MTGEAVRLRLSRRQFVTAALGLAGAAVACSVPLAGCAPRAYPGPAGRALRCFTPRQWATLDAAGRTLWPDMPEHPGAGVAQTATAADGFFATVDPHVTGELKQLLDTLEGLTWLTGRLSPFSALPPAERMAYLAAWRDAPVALPQRAYAALVRLTGMLTYVQPVSWPAIAYPGPWVGRLDVGLGLGNQGAMAASPNPHVFKRWAGA